MDRKNDKCDNNNNFRTSYNIIILGSDNWVIPARDKKFNPLFGDKCDKFDIFVPEFRRITLLGRQLIGYICLSCYSACMCSHC